MQELLFQQGERATAVDQLHAATALYTAAPIIDKLLDRIGWPHAHDRLFDPAAGDGAFVLRALHRLTLAPDDAKEAARIQAWEIHPGAVAEARINVRDLLLERGWTHAIATQTADMMIAERDFLTEALPTECFTAIAGNPPYLRFANLPPFFKDLYGAVVARYARNDLLHAFLDRCIAMLPDNGTCALVTSDRWVQGEGAAELRERLGQKVAITFLGRLPENGVFHRPKNRRKATPPRCHPIEVVFGAPQGDNVIPLTRRPISADGHQDDPNGRTLADIAQVRIAPWLGKEGIWLVNDATAAQLAQAGLVHATLIPAVDTDDIDPQSDTIKKPKRFAIKTVSDNEPTGAVRDHLLAQTHRMPSGRSSRYWMPPETITLPLDQPALLIPRIAVRLRAIPLPPGILAVSHNLQVIVGTPEVTLEQIRDILLCQSSQDWITRNAPRLENGYLSITTKLLRRLPLPDQANVAAAA